MGPLPVKYGADSDAERRRGRSMHTRIGPVAPHGSMVSALCAASVAATPSDAVWKAAQNASPTL